MATVRDLATTALKEIGVLAEGQVMTAEEGSDTLAAFNRLVDSWAAERLQIYTVTRTTWTITSGTSTYLVGPAQVVAVARPMYINAINFQDTSVTPTVEYQLTLLTDDMYAQLSQKTLTSTYPNAAYYNPTFTTAAPYGTIILWPVPTSTTLQGVLYAPLAIAQFSSLDDTVSLPPGYQRMIVKNLALEMAPTFEKNVSELLAVQASKAIAVVKAANKRIRDLNIDPSALVQGTKSWYGAYNIYLS